MNSTTCCFDYGLPRRLRLTIPSIVRRAQYENLKAVLGRIQDEENFITRWLAIEEKILRGKEKSIEKWFRLNMTKRKT